MLFKSTNLPSRIANKTCIVVVSVIMSLVAVTNYLIINVQELTEGVSIDLRQAIKLSVEIQSRYL